MSSNSTQIGEYARLLVERCLGVQPGWQVTVRSSPLARPLVEEVTRRIARRGAYALVRLSYGLERLPHDLVWAAEAPLELLRTMPPIEMHAFETENARISIVAPENTRDGSDLSPERQAALRQGHEPATRRSRALEIPWVICEYPTPAGAQDARMTLAEYEEFVFGACLLDWDAERRKMEGIAERFDGAEEVRIVAEGTDLRLGIAGRKGEIDDGHLNLPGGEVFYGPVEDATEGVITYAESRPSTKATKRGACGCASRAAASSRPRRRPARIFWSARSTPTPARACSASSGSAATPRSGSTCATFSTTRRSTARCTWRSATATRSPAART